MQLRPLATAEAPKAIGPYSQAVAAGDLVFCSGQLGLDPATGELVSGPGREESVARQAERALLNLAAVLASEGMGLDRVAKTTIFLADMGDFAAVNEIYAKFFPAPCPARSTVQVAGLPRKALVEVEAIAVRAGA